MTLNIDINISCMISKAIHLFQFKTHAPFINDYVSTFASESKDYSLPINLIISIYFILINDTKILFFFYKYLIKSYDRRYPIR